MRGDCLDLLVLGDGRTLHWNGFPAGPARARLSAARWLAARGVDAPFAAYRKWILTMKRQIREEDAQLRDG